MVSRRDFLQTLAAGATLVLPTGCKPSGARESQERTPVIPEQAPAKSRMPVLFMGHGSPMNMIADNPWSPQFVTLRQQIPQPKAILMISAHWFVNGTYLTGNANPKTIHDFSGFPRSMYEIQYPAPGHVDLAKRVRHILGQQRASLNMDWGFDHGTWTILHWMFPEANTPVLQLSIDRRLTVEQHHELGRSLRSLRDEEVLIIGSGNVTHNLRDAIQRMRTRNTETPDWAKRFDETVKQATAQHDTKKLLSMGFGTDDGRKSHPTPDHWLPILYAQAATDDSDKVQFPIEGFDGGSISMRTIMFG